MDSISLFSGVGGLDLGLRRPVVEVTLNFFCVFVYAINVCVSPYVSHVQQPCCSAGSASSFLDTFTWAQWIMTTGRRSALWGWTKSSFLDASRNFIPWPVNFVKHFLGVSFEVWTLGVGSGSSVAPTFGVDGVRKSWGPNCACFCKMHIAACWTGGGCGAKRLGSKWQEWNPSRQKIRPGGSGPNLEVPSFGSLEVAFRKCSCKKILYVWLFQKDFN